MSSETIYSKKFNYVYRITNTVINKHYYGIRSSNIEPKYDLGVRYFSSSKDKEFRKDQKLNPRNYYYKIVAKFKTRYEALLREILLHTKFDVKSNENFYNLANSICTGFDTSGVKYSEERKAKYRNIKRTPESIEKSRIGNIGSRRSEETKAKMRISRAKQIFSEETKAKIKKSNTGKVHSEETKTKMSLSRIGKSIKRRRITCPHCDKIGSSSNMKRYHFENCKLNPERIE